MILSLLLFRRFRQETDCLNFHACLSSDSEDSFFPKLSPAEVFS
jgi:hypothetical protein